MLMLQTNDNFLPFRSLDAFTRIITVLLFLLERWKWKTNTSLSNYRDVASNCRTTGCRTNGLLDYSYAPIREHL